MKHLVEILLSLKAETWVWNAISKKRWISNDKNYVEARANKLSQLWRVHNPNTEVRHIYHRSRQPERQKMKHTQSIKLDSIGRSDMQQFNYHGNSLNLSHAEPPGTNEERFIANVKDQPIHFQIVIGAKSAFDFHKK